MLTLIYRRRNGGFTLIEMMVVVLILGLLLALAIPGFMRAKDTTRLKSCLKNQSQITSAKEQYAMQHSLQDGASVTMEELVPVFLKAEPKCPSLGTYLLNPIGDPVQCTYPGHSGSE